MAEKDLLYPNGPWCTLPGGRAERRGRVTSDYADVTRLADVFAEAGKPSVRTMIYRRGATGCLLAQRHRGDASIRTRGLQTRHRRADRTMDFRPYWARPAVVTVKSWRQPTRP